MIVIAKIWKFLKKLIINEKNEINIKGDGNITQIGNHNTASINNSISKRDEILNKIQNSKREDWTYEERDNKNFSLFNEKEQIIISHCPPIIKKRREILIKVLEEWQIIHSRESIVNKYVSDNCFLFNKTMSSIHKGFENKSLSTGLSSFLKKENINKKELLEEGLNYLLKTITEDKEDKQSKIKEIIENNPPLAKKIMNICSEKLNLLYIFQAHNSPIQNVEFKIEPLKEELLEDIKAEISNCKYDNDLL